MDCVHLVMLNVGVNCSGRVVAPVFRHVVQKVCKDSDGTDGIKEKLWDMWFPVLFGDSRSTVHEELEDEVEVDEVIKLHEQ